ncbi:MAG TPA: DUF2232 domain-containing protein [bacterium]|nr:DUF2232 domain-containing protein [bacterium]
MEALLVLVVQAVVAVFFFILTSLASAWALLRSFKPRQVVLTGAFAMLLMALAVSIIGRPDQKENPLVSFQQYFTEQHFEDEWQADYQTAVKMGAPQDKLEGFKDDYKQYFYNLLPSWIASGCLVFGLIAYYLVSFILSRVTTRVPKAMPFQEWVLPEPLVFGLIAAGIIKVVARQNVGLDLLGGNLLVFFTVIYVLGGFSIVSFFLHKWHLPATLRILSYLILVQLPLDTVCALGVLDVWFDFRKLKRPRTETTA